MSSTSRNFGQWKILLICPSRSMLSELAPLLAEYLPFSPVHELAEYPTRAALAETIEAEGSNLCFVDGDSSRDWSLALLNDLSGLDAKLPIVALHAGNDSEHILKTLRQGATEFLFQPFTTEHFVSVMERVSATCRGRNQSSAKVYCVMPAKGACGASTVASNLAQHWKKLGAKRILLADLDPFAGTLSFQLKLRQSYSFMDALTRGSQLDEDIWKGMVHASAGVDIILAPEQPVHGIDEAHSPAGMIEFARSIYDVMVLDCGGPYGQWNQTIARLSDELILVTTNELPSLQAAQRALGYLDRNRVEHAKIKVIVNRYNKDMGLNREMIESALHTDVFHLVPSDYEDVQRALVEGKSLPTGTSVGRSLLQLAEKLAGKQAAAPAPKPSSLSSLFSFLKR